MPTIKTEHEYSNPNINPIHYNSHPSGVECIEITEHMSFTLGNVIKYVWRADLKGGIEDLEKALWYLTREIQRRRNLIKKAYETPQGAQQKVKGDFESFKEYINEASSHNKNTQDTKRS